MKNILGWGLVSALVFAGCSEQIDAPARDASASDLGGGDVDASADLGAPIDSSILIDATTTDAASLDLGADAATPLDADLLDAFVPQDSEVEPDGGTGAMCGGFAGFRCADGYFCGYPAGECHVADGLGSCYKPTDFCTAIYRPVCGCDGTTYSNACNAARAGAQIDREGRCDACPPQDAVGEGECDRFFGYALGNLGCYGVSGCDCLGEDCDALFDTVEDCETYGESCGTE